VLAVGSGRSVGQGLVADFSPVARVGGSMARVFRLSVGCVLSLLGRSVLVVFCAGCVLHVLWVRSMLF
jgi:hypothetical protein